MAVTCVFGMQWGDEGKGRVVDLLAAGSDVVVRYQGGANAGHTVVVGADRYVLHLLPSGSLHPDTTNVIGCGVVVDPWTLMEEIDGLAERGIRLDGRLLLSDRAHVVLPYHRLMDRAMEALRGDAALGTTSRGVGPAYGDKYTREGLRVADLLSPARFTEALRASVAARNLILARAGIETLDEARVLADTERVAERLRPYVADTTAWLLDAWQVGRRILVEGAQGFGLDVDHGSYPFVTSSSTGSAGVCAGTGLPPKAIDRVLGVVKAYTTRVGAGPFPTRDTGPAGRYLAERGREFGSTTGRPRACGWFDAVLARRAAATQGVDAAMLMKLDVLSGLDELRVGVAYELGGRRLDAPPAYAGDWAACRPVYETYPGWQQDLSGVRRFEDLPAEARAYVQAIQRVMDVPIGMISVGAERDRFIETEAGVPVGA
jgi:adenylosuccinate synthase